MVKKWVGVCIVALAAVAAAVPWPQTTVERWYSTGIYPVIQRPVTAASNLVPFAVADVAILGILIVWLARLVGDVRRAPRPRRRSVAVRVVVRTVVAAAGMYLAFLALWGLNYRRVPLERKLVFDLGAVTAG